MSEQICEVVATPSASVRPTASTRFPRLALYCATIAAALLIPALSTLAQLPTLDVSKTASQTPTKKTDDAPSSDEPAKISTKAPDIPVDQVIKKFGDRELEFKKERDNYTYTQTFVVQTIDFDGRPDGEYRMTSDILFTPDGKRYEKVVSAPTPTLVSCTSPRWRAGCWIPAGTRPAIWCGPSSRPSPTSRYGPPSKGSRPGPPSDCYVNSRTRATPCHCRRN